MKSVLFVCVENSCRSQLAEAFGHIHSCGNIAVYSAGSRPSGEVNPKAVATMRERGYDMSAHQSQGLSEIPDIGFDAIITMGCGDSCQSLKAKLLEDWNLPDPKYMDADEFRGVRDTIEQKVVKLLQRI